MSNSVLLNFMMNTVMVDLNQRVIEYFDKLTNYILSVSKDYDEIKFYVNKKTKEEVSLNYYIHYCLRIEVLATFYEHKIDITKIEDEYIQKFVEIFYKRYYNEFYKKIMSFNCGKKINFY